MNFAVSDTAGRETSWAWLRCFPNPYHHTFAITEGPDNILNHIAFKVKTVDDIGNQVNLLNEKNIPILLDQEDIIHQEVFSFIMPIQMALRLNTAKAWKSSLKKEQENHAA